MYAFQRSKFTQGPITRFLEFIKNCVRQFIFCSTCSANPSDRLFFRVRRRYVFVVFGRVLKNAAGSGGCDDNYASPI